TPPAPKAPIVSPVGCSMRLRKLGTQGLEVSAIGLGAMGMSGVAGMADMYGAVDEAEAIATLHRAIDIGVTFSDTAEVYGPYTNESLVGRALAGGRARALIATQLGSRLEGAKRRGVDGSPDN